MSLISSSSSGGDNGSSSTSGTCDHQRDCSCSPPEATKRIGEYHDDSSSSGST